MAFWTNIADVHKNRPLKPRYARTQATPQAVVLHPEEDKAIWPGAVLTRFENDTVKVCTGTNPCGLCGTWTKELELTGAKDVAMWVLGSDAIMALTAYNGDEFDVEGIVSDAKTALEAGEAFYLKSDGDGKLTADGSEPTDASIARVVGVEGPNTILIAGI